MYFWPIDFINANAAHVWVVAPPFNIIDISIKQQPYENNVLEVLPDFVFEKELHVKNVKACDLASPEVRMQLHEVVGDNNDLEAIFNIAPELRDFFQNFPSNSIKRGLVSLKYIPCNVTASDLPFEKIKSLKLNGRYGINIYDDIIRPAIHNF